MDIQNYKAAAERTDADERALIPAIRRTPNKAKPQHSSLPWKCQQGRYADFDAPHHDWSITRDGFALAIAFVHVNPEANAKLIVRAVNNYSNAIQALRDITAEIKLGTLNVRKDFSLMVAHAAATKAIRESEES